MQPKFAPWMHLLNHGDDASFLDLTGFSRHAFMLLEQCVFSGANVKRVGRPSALDNRGKLGLYLFFIGSKMATKQLLHIWCGSIHCKCDINQGVFSL